ncbi:Phomopsin biosynthesis cluster protein C' [Exophiala dermatitidis]
MSQSTTNVKELPEFSRHITTHDADGVAVFQTPDPDADDLSAAATSCPAPPISTFPTWTNYPGSAFGLAYATATIPADCNANADLEAYYQYLHSHPGITIKGGSVLRVVDMAPGTISPMHRTVSLDYGVVLEGEVELELDSGEKRLLPRGDLFVQRGTMHRWKNPSDTQPARLLLVHLDSTPVVVEGKGTLPETMT